MKELEELIDRVEEELNDAEHYAWEAMNHKGKEPELSSTYAELSRQELTHADMLCTQVDRLLRKEKEEEPERYKEDYLIWEWHHRKFNAKKHRVRSVLTSA